MRILVLSLVVSAGALYEIYATDILGINGVTISGNLYVTSTLTVGGNEGATATGSLILWDGPTCPTGWTDVSASYANRFPLGGTSLLNSGVDTHDHGGAHGHGSSFSLSTLTHTHTFGGSDDTVGHSHTETGCGLQGTTFFGPAYAAAGGSTSTDNHNHGGYSGNTDAADSHSHTIIGSTYGPNQVSSAEYHIPLYRTLKLCKKW
jgi:hypothetical protein